MSSPPSCTDGWCCKSWGLLSAMQCTIARRVGIAMAPTIKNPPNQVLSLKPGQLWVGTRHTQRSWIISGHADCQGRCKRGTAWMIFKSVNKQTNNLWFKTFHLDRLWQSCWVWQWCCRPRTPSLTTWSSCRWTWPGTWAWPGRAQSVKTRFCWQHFFCGKSGLSRWWQQWMWQLRRQTGVAPKQWVVSPILVGNINQISWNIEKHTFAGKAEHVQHWEARWQCDGAGFSHFLSHNYPTVFRSLASGYRGDSTELRKEVSCVAGGTFCSSPEQRWTTLQAVSYQKMSANGRKPSLRFSETSLSL